MGNVKNRFKWITYYITLWSILWKEKPAWKVRLWVQRRELNNLWGWVAVLYGVIRIDFMEKINWIELRELDISRGRMWQLVHMLWGVGVAEVSEKKQVRLDLRTKNKMGGEVSGAKSGRTLGAVLRYLRSALELDIINLKPWFCCLLFTWWWLKVFNYFESLSFSF